MADNETTADIIAEMRFDATTRDQFDSAYIVDFCDRFEAAHKREKAAIEADALAVGGMVAAAAEKPSAVGDAAKLREALKAICGLCDGLTPTWDGAVGRIKDMADAALAAPPRNCDRPECATTKAAQDVWRKEDGGKTAYYEWLLSTYKKGDDYGNE